MPRFDMLSDQQHRHLVHMYAALRECVADAVEYNREPDFPPLDEETKWVVATIMTQQLTELMVEAHAEEAATLDGEIAAYPANNSAPEETSA